MAIAALSPTRRSDRRGGVARHGWLRPALLGLLLAAMTIVPRLYQLDSLPGTLFYDEAQNGVDAARVAAGARPIFFEANNGREPLYIYLQAIAVALLGPTPLALRLVSAVAGCLTVGAVYVLGRELLDRRVGYCAALWLATTYWHLALSRLGFRTVLLPLVSALAIALIARWLRNGRLWWALVAGGTSGLVLYTYISARMFPIVAILFVLFGGPVALGRPPGVGGLASRRWLGGAAGFALAAGLVVAPLGLYFARHPDLLVERGQQVILGGDLDPRVWRLHLRPRDLIENTAVTLGAIGFDGDPTLRHNLPHRPILSLAGLALVVLGLWSALRVRQLRRPGLLCLAWLLVMAVPGAVSTDAPHFLRLTGILPPLVVLVGLGTARLLSSVPHRRLALALVVAAIGLSFGQTIYDYFVVFRADPERPAWFDANVALAVERTNLARQDGSSVAVVSRAPHPDFDFLLRPERRPNLPAATVPEAVARVRAQGAAASVECFGCRWRLAGDLLYVTVLVISHPADPPGFVRLDRPIDGLGLTLVGFDVAPTDLDPRAERLTLWLRWRVTAPIGTNYAAAAWLRDPATQISAVVDDRSTADLWPSTMWQPGDEIATPLELPDALRHSAGPIEVSVELRAVQGVQLGRLPYEYGRQSFGARRLAPFTITLPPVGTRER